MKGRYGEVADVDDAIVVYVLPVPRARDCARLLGDGLQVRPVHPTTTVQVQGRLYGDQVNGDAAGDISGDLLVEA